MQKTCKAIKKVADRWGVARSIVVAWVVTIPAAALIGALFHGLAARLAV